MKISLTKDLAALRTAALARLQKAAAAERALSQTPGKAGIYASKRDEAERWIAFRGATKPLPVPVPSAADYPFLAAEVGLSGANADAVANLWKTKADLWNNVTAPLIEHRYMAAKGAVDTATTPAAIDAVKF